MEGREQPAVLMVTHREQRALPVDAVTTTLTKAENN